MAKKMIPALRDSDMCWRGEGPTWEAAEAAALEAYDEWAGAESDPTLGGFPGRGDAERYAGVLPPDRERWDVFRRIVRRGEGVFRVVYLRAGGPDPYSGD